ncbi:DNA-binding transcriptional LysR family regulator [Sporomusaceae bacterium BoRhaA]|uniref:LysR family transcriptional regulator n=1 Tax=Pelorhabdus rhamnosifermentans TaxID=2772457 RepID=UPI001C061BDD|nr:LysR family transcriptional regulator [Pelorhabdus rhamnosifermentans]MBU2699449.1 DNA-binding transcriptional LysR family regulator [Pelorhabdus rhamnosifermentans]
MNDKDWLILKTLNEAGNLTKAAEYLYVSQPALTYRLHCIEKEFGIKIFERYPRGISLTKNGEYLVRYAENMLIEQQKIKKILQNGELPVEGNLKLGISTVFAKFKFAPLLKQYKKRFSHVNISLKTGSSTLLLPYLLEKDEIDLAILRGDLDWPEEKHIILEEPWCLVYPRPLEFKELPDIPWILDETSKITKADEQFHLWWKEQFGSPPPTPIWVNSIEASIQLISNELGWGIIPKIYLSKSNSLFASPLYFKNGTPLLRKTIMIYKKEVLKQSQIRTFVDLVMKQMSRTW